MKAAIYFGPENIRCTEIPDPVLRADHEMLVKVLATSICGSDLHLYRGALDPIMEKGKSQTGHELVGEVVQVGKSVQRFRTGDRISMAYSVSCGECYMCQVDQTAHCETTQKAIYGFGVPFGNLNGTHAEALVIPFADAHAIKVPKEIPDAAALTAQEICLQSGIALSILRPAIIYGFYNYAPRESYFFDLLLNRQPIVIPSEDLALYSFIWVVDMARMIIGCIGNEQTHGRVFSLASDELISYSRIVQVLEEITGKSINVIRLSTAEIERQGVSLPFPLDEHLIYSGTKIQQLLGFSYIAIYTSAAMVDEHLRRRNFWAYLDHPVVGLTLYNRAPIMFSRTPLAMESPAPSIGQHTREVLTGMLGYSEAEVERMSKEDILV